MESQLIYFQFMHCFEGHHVTTLGEITSNSGGHHVQVKGVRPSNILKISLKLELQTPTGFYQEKALVGDFSEIMKSYGTFV